MLDSFQIEEYKQAGNDKNIVTNPAIFGSEHFEGIRSGTPAQRPFLVMIGRRDSASFFANPVMSRIYRLFN